MTSLGSGLPVLQAEPEEQAKPAESSICKRRLPSTSLKTNEAWFGRRFSRMSCQSRVGDSFEDLPDDMVAQRFDMRCAGLRVLLQRDAMPQQSRRCTARFESQPADQIPVHRQSGAEPASSPCGRTTPPPLSARRIYARQATSNPHQGFEHPHQDKRRLERRLCGNTIF